MTKTLTVSDEAYERLASRKEYGESFSSVIKKLTGKSTLMDLVGLFTEEEADELRKNIKKGRERSRKRLDETARRLQ